VAAAISVDDTRARFIEILCADAEWLEAEFKQIVSDLFPVPTGADIWPGRSVGSVGEVNRSTVPPRSSWARSIAERVRAPPADSSRLTVIADHYFADGMSRRPSMRGDIHHVDVI
jgi:hypothetical protein